MEPRLDAVPAPDPGAEPEGFLVVQDGIDRIHFLDWGGPTEAEPDPNGPPGPGATDVLLIHGLGSTAWAWAPVARRLRGLVRTVALDLRGHGLSDAPTGGYEPERLVDDVVAVAEGAGLLATGESVGEGGGGRLVLAGHGFGGVVAAWTAARLGPSCAGLVLVDGGWEDVRATSGMEPDEWLRDLDEPPEIMRSMAAFLADRAGFDPASWDADQERAARATVVEVPAGHLLPAVRPHARAGMVGALFAYRPDIVLPAVEAPIVALVAAADEEGTRGRALDAAQAILARGHRPAMGVVDLAGAGHNLMRYRPVEVTRAILSLVGR